MEVATSERSGDHARSYLSSTAYGNSIKSDARQVRVSNLEQPGTLQISSSPSALITGSAPVGPGSSLMTSPVVKSITRITGPSRLPDNTTQRPLVPTPS